LPGGYGKLRSVKERNLCVESGCPAPCCSNVWLALVGEEKKRVKDYFPGVIELDQNDLHDKYLIINGVYCSEYRGKLEVKIVGPCPNLKEGYDCDIYQDKPNACKLFVMGGEECSKAKKSVFRKG